MIDFGRVTCAREMLASPGRATRIARSFGFLARLVAPKVRRNSFGAKSRPSQPESWNGAVAGTEVKAAGSAGLAPPPCRMPANADAVQLVPLREKPGGRSILTETVRRSSRVPP